MRIALAIAVLVAGARAGGARAGGVLDVPDIAGDIPDPTLRFEVGANVDIGRFEAGNVGDLAYAAGAQVGVRYDRFAVLARATYAWLSPVGDDPRDIRRTGGALRVGGELHLNLTDDRVLATKHGHPMHYERDSWWVGAGGGCEWISWDGGGGDTRPYGAVLAGYTGLARFGAAQGGHVIAGVALEVDVAPAPTSQTDPTTHGGDVSVLGTFMVSVGD